MLFVHDGDADAAEHTARAVLSTMTTSNEYGIVFRTDANLRPEGRQGPLTRTLESYATYYDEWARTWEFQALVKARPVAGDRDLGAGSWPSPRPASGPIGSSPTPSARSGR